MASISATFTLIDEMSDKLAAIAQNGSDAVETWENMGTAANTAQGEAVSAADATATSARDVGEAAQTATSATEDLSDATKKAADNAEDAGNRTNDAIQTVYTALSAAGLTKMVSEIADALMECSDAAAEFETSMLKVSTVADTSEVSLDELTSGVKTLSQETGVGVNELSEAMYQALSASVDTANAVDFTATAVQLAAGGFTSTTTAVDVLTTALNAYGLEASEASNISDMLITTQNLGKTTVDELAKTMGRVIPTASAYNVEMDNIGAAYAELTKNGLNTRISTTYLNSMLQELGDSGSTVAEILQNETGMSLSGLMDAGYSLGDVLDILGNTVNGDTAAFNELWSSSTAGMAALTLYNAGADEFNSTLAQMDDSAGATAAAYDTMTDSTQHAQEELSNAASNLQIAIGDAINPAIESLYSAGASMLNVFTDFANEHPVVVKAAAAIAVGIGAVVVGISAVAFVTGVAIPAIKALGVAFNTALGPIGWVVMGVTAVVAAVGAFVAMMGSAEDETAGMTASTRAQYYELQDLNAEYENACATYGETSEEALRLKYQMDDLTAAFEENQKSVEQLQAEVDSLCESADNIASSFQNSMDSISSDEVGTLALIQKYEDLASQSNLTGAEEKQLQAVTKSLTDSYPDLISDLDKAGASTEDYVEAMRKACEAEAEEQRQQQAQETYIDALKEREELTQKLAEVQEEYNLEAARLDEMGTFQHMFTFGEYDDLNAYSDMLDELNAAIAENDAVISSVEQSWADLATAEEEAASQAKSFDEAVEDAYEAVQANVEELVQAYEDAYNAALESFQGQFSLWDAAKTNSDDYADYTVEKTKQALDSQLEYWQSYNENLQSLSDYGSTLTGEARENFEALMNYASDGSEEAYGLAMSMAEAIAEGDTAAVEELSNTLAQVTESQQEAAATTAEWQTDFTEQMQGYAEDMAVIITDDLELSEEAAASAESTIEAYANQILAGKAAAVAAAEEVASAVTSALSSASTNITVTASGSANVHAKGTTNAESVFIAGERGPELVARPASKYATGTAHSDDYFIAGENGPELIVGEQGSEVFPTSETDRLIRVLNGMGDRTEDIQPVSGADGMRVRQTGGSTEDKKITIEIDGKGSIQVSGDGKVDDDTLVDFLYEYLKPVLMDLLKQEVYEEGDYSYGY